MFKSITIFFLRFLYYDKLLIGWFHLFKALIISYRALHNLKTYVKTNHLKFKKKVSMKRNKKNQHDNSIPQLFLVRHPLTTRLSDRLLNKIIFNVYLYYFF